nr:unnamed protein product [Naegleria fowleri]
MITAVSEQDQDLYKSDDDVQSIVAFDEESDECLESFYEDLWLEDGEIGSDEEEIEILSLPWCFDDQDSEYEQEEEEDLSIPLESKYDYLNFEDYVSMHGLFGGNNTHRTHGMKQVKSKYKKTRMNPKRRIHHREYKKRLEEEANKIELQSSKVYVPPPIRYATSSSDSPNQHYYSRHAPRSEEEEQLQLAIALSMEHHEISNVARECGMDMNILLALTTRELTDKDYDLLLQLDNRVQKKTVCSSTLSNLPTCILSFEEKHLSSLSTVAEEVPQVCKGDMCVTCMCDFEEGEELKWIPRCGHIFHRSCIDSWLESQSTVCPICRIDVADS